MIEIEKTYKRYEITPEYKLRLQAWHYHSPKQETMQPQRYEMLNKATREVAEMMMAYCPPGRQLSLALTKLEEARMWANNAIAMEGEQ